MSWAGVDVSSRRCLVYSERFLALWKCSGQNCGKNDKECNDVEGPEANHCAKRTVKDASHEKNRTG